MREQVYSWLGGLCDQLLPASCLLCGRRGQRPGLDLCRSCASEFPADVSAGDLRPGETGSPAMAHGLEPSALWPCDRWYAAYVYATPVDVLVQALKYRGQLAAGRVLGVLLGTAITRRGLHLGVGVVVPVPLHPVRHAERGFNQSAEIGRWVARVAGRRFREDAVSRIRNTRQQVGLHLDERRTNLAGAFSCARSLGGQRVAVVDDVLTTGSTACALAQAMREAGVESVDLWCVARALPPGQPVEPPARWSAADR